MRIEAYKPAYKEEFIAMNLAWISQMFTLEEEDERILSSIEDKIEEGAQIYFAISPQEEIMAACMIAPLENGDWEIEKFAAKSEFAGTGAGSACLKACMDFVQREKIKKVVIVSNRKCVAALHLYRKFGFVEVPVDKERFPYERADIAFEQVFSY